VCISADPADGPLPPGEPGRLDYRLAFPTMADEARTGISSTGLARALAELSDGALAVVPVAGPWTAASVEELLRLATAEPGVVCPIGNLATAPLWSAKTETASALRFLRDGDDRGEPSEWQVGHFVGLWGVVAGAAGTLVLVADTYPSLGRNGIHLQPADRVARALERPDGNGGGVLLVVRADRREHTERALVDAGFTLAPWDNGSADQHEDR
jgi:hypothetical protein